MEESSPKIDLKSNGTLCTEKSILDETFKNKMAYDTIGAHDIDEFYNRPFYYLDWNSSENIKDFNGYRCTYALLRCIQNFTFDLWHIKDNSVYIFSGFLFEYDNLIADGSTYKGTLTATMSKANLEKSNTLFTERELQPVISEMPPIVIDDLLKKESDYFTPTSEHFFKSGGLDRIGRASYFALEARTRHTYPTKIVSYITAMECLFTTSTSELSHRISERAAILTDGTKEAKLETYKLLKKAYDVRSKIVHGSTLTGRNDDLKEITIGLDHILRELLTRKNEIFTKSNDQIDDYFLNKLF